MYWNPKSSILLLVKRGYIKIMGESYFVRGCKREVVVK
jgi:hypothetical protein